jgi:hypothetical protein
VWVVQAARASTSSAATAAGHPENLTVRR